jgi:hypothetical protein
VKTKRWIDSTAFMALLAVAALPASAQESYRVSGPRVAVYNLAGDVEVVPGQGSEVVVTVTRGGSDASELDVEMHEVDGYEALVVRYPSDEVVYDRGRRGNSSTTIRVRDDGTWGGAMRGGDEVRVRTSGRGLEAHADLRIEVPEGRDIRVFLAVGETMARGLRGDVGLDSGSGRIDVEDIVGDLSVDTGSGSVSVAGVEGEVTIHTGSGSVEVEGVRGAVLTVDTGSGTVDATGIEAEMVEVDTGSGSVEMAQITASSIVVDTGSGAVDLHVLSAVDRIVIDTGSGGVTLRLPDGIDAEMEADSGNGGIDVDVPIQVVSQRRNYLRGVMGDGRGRIEIETGSGRIRIVRN